MLEKQIEQHERRATLENDRRVREQTSTLHQHAQAQANDLAGGRFAAIGNPQIVGQSAIPSYPAASAHQRDPVPDEPPLGYAIGPTDCSLVDQGPDEPTSGERAPTGELGAARGVGSSLSQGNSVSSAPLLRTVGVSPDGRTELPPKEGNRILALLSRKARSRDEAEEAT